MRKIEIGVVLLVFLIFTGIGLAIFIIKKQTLKIV